MSSDPLHSHPHPQNLGHSSLKPAPVRNLETPPQASYKELVVVLARNEWPLQAPFPQLLAYNLPGPPVT